MTDALLDAIPGWWHRFGTVLSFSVRRVTDPESWLPRYDGELILTDDGGEVHNEAALVDSEGDVAAIKTMYSKQKDAGVSFTFEFDDEF